MTETVNILFILFVILAAVTALRVRELVGAVFLFSTFGFFLALIWAVLAAPDVAFTEAMVGAGASTIFLILALSGSRHFAAEEKFGMRHLAALALVLFLGGLFIWGSLDLPSFGTVTSAASQHLSPYYLQHAFRDMHTPNVVTAVVVDYRGFDTLIETTVIFTAGVACLFIMRSRL